MEKFKLNLGEKDLEVEIRNLAEKANGSCWVKYGDTVVMATAVMSSQERGDQDFFPLTVEYQERFYAAGKILGSRFLRRENRPTDEAIITSRIIDRSIRPRFPKELKKEIQVIITCLSWDRENNPDVLGLIATSVALGISDIPWQGPIAAVRIGEKDNNFILNPTYSQKKEENLDIILASTPSEKDPCLINMIEGEGNEVSEETILGAVKFSKPYLEKIIDFQKEIVKKIGKKKTILPEKQIDREVEQEIKKLVEDKLEKAIYEGNEMQEVEILIKEVLSLIEEKYPGEGKTKYASTFLEAETDRIIHENIIKSEKRPDKRRIDEIRKLSMQVGILPRTHGTGLFERGKTKSLSVLTLGAPDDVKLVEGMEAVGKKRFMHHYNFPPYCSGETKPLRGPGRREIGHGMLAEKALFPVIPDFEEFPYTLRIVSEILSSNGSSSMASTCSSSLSLMDSGVPIKNHVAGIAMGLMSNEKGEYKILTDIQGPEDHYGDMDFKIAGTKNGVNAIQLDVKVSGINEEIIKETLERGKKAKLQILKEMEKTIDKPRESLSKWAPRVYILQVDSEKIGEIIGPGGRIIRDIIEKSGAEVNIEDSGKVFVTAENEESAQKAISQINDITREAKIGEIFQGKVKRILDFGAFVEILPNQEGLVHISQLASFHVKKVEDIIKIGDIVPVKVISIDEQGRINLSMKEVKE